MEDWVTIRNIKKRNPSIGTREVAKILGISRNTVKNALRNSTYPAYSRVCKINPQIEPFKEYILQQIAVKHLRGSRVLNDIISKGYQGSSSAYYRFLASHNFKEKRTFRRYETQPGEQAQFDWSPYTVVIDSRLTKVYVFSYILGFSRYRIYEAGLSETQAGVFEALENSITELGGCAGRLQTDNSTCFINNASRDNLEYNPRYLSFCGHYNFKPTRSLPAHPWSKGKVEKPFQYVEDHFIKGNEFYSFEDLLERLKQFQKEVNNRIHTTTNKLPSELFEVEKSLLLEPPERRYVGIKEEVRKVSADCLFSFSGSRYSVPSIFATKEVWLRVSKGYMLEVYSSGNILIAEHKLSLEKGKIIIEKSHYKNHNIERGNFRRLSQMFLESFPQYGWFIENLKIQKKLSYTYHLTRIVDLLKFYQSADMIMAFSACSEVNVYAYPYIKGYLENNVRVDVEDIKISENSMFKANELLLKKINIKRSLSEYKLFN